MATYYWVGGDGTWDASSTTNWSLTSGGAGNAGVPNSADTVVFDSASGTGTCTTASGSAAAVATLNTATLGLALGANHTMSSAFTLTLGSLSLNNFTLSCGAFISNNANVRSVAFGTGNITLTGNGIFALSMADATNFTYTGTPTINSTYAGATGTRSFRFGATGATASNVLNINISAGTDSISTSTLRVKNLNFTGFSGTLLNQGVTIFGDLTFSSGMTCTAGASSMTFVAISGIQQITTNANATIDFPFTFNGVGGTFQLQDNLTTGSTRTVTLTNGALDLNNQTLSCGLFSSSNSNTRSIAFGTGKFVISSSGATVWNCLDATNLTYSGTPLVDFTYVGATGTRNIRNGNTGVSGSSAIALSINILGGSDATSLTGYYQNTDYTGYTGSSSTSVFSYGNYTLGTGMTIAGGSGAITFAGTSGAQQITTNGVAVDRPLTFNGVGGAWSFADALTQGSTRAFTITNGTVKLKAGATSTVGAFTTSGSNQKYLQSTTAGSQATLSQASGTVNASYLTIKDINATGGATWNAYRSLRNIDAGNNTGWDFLSTPVTTTTLAMRLGFGL
jgi:hypothetical protein